MNNFYDHSAKAEWKTNTNRQQDVANNWLVLGTTLIFGLLIGVLLF